VDCAEAHAERDFRDRLLLLLVARPKEGWEAEFQELIRREIARFAILSAEKSAGA
jgi:hypothetical protein